MAGAITSQRSEAQRQQARINGAKSRGPRTAEGKAKSCRNAVKHGYRSEAIVAAEDLPHYEDLRDGILSDLPRSTRVLDAVLAGSIASAVIRVEKLGSARISAVAEEKRQVRKRHDRQLEKITSTVLRDISEGKILEAFESHRQTPKGCELIAEIWSSIRDRLASLSPGSPIPDETWREILGRVVTLEPLYQSVMRHQYEEAARTGFITPAMMIEHCESYIRVFRDRAARLNKERRRSLKHKLTIAEADLGKEGQLRERYLGMARSSIARHAQQMDMETHRQWRRDKEGWPAPNEPDDPPQVETDSTVEAAPGGMPSSSRAGQGPEASAEPSATDPQAEFISCEPDPAGPAHPHEDEGMPPEAHSQPELPAPNEPDASPQAPTSTSFRDAVESLRPPWLTDEDDDAILAVPIEDLADVSDLLAPSALGRLMAEKLRAIFPESAAPNEPKDSPKLPTDFRVTPGRVADPGAPWPDRDRP